MLVKNKKLNNALKRGDCGVLAQTDVQISILNCTLVLY